MQQKPNLGAHPSHSQRLSATFDSPRACSPSTSDPEQAESDAFLGSLSTSLSFFSFLFPPEVPSSSSSSSSSCRSGSGSGLGFRRVIRRWGGGEVNFVL
ncbi:hypothetical protein DsansV1_C10g0100001 [Dioscorea sansibarensis]